MASIAISIPTIVSTSYLRRQPTPSSLNLRSLSAVADKRSFFGLKSSTPREGSVMVKYMTTFILPDGEKVEVECDDTTYLLDAAEEAGVDLPYSCRAGACSSCVGKLVSGSVDQSEQSMLEDDQIKAGFVLTCVAYPTSDLVIETHKEEHLY